MANEVHIHNGPLIIGAGLAGLSVALNTAPQPALVLAPVELGAACSSAWAQGGIAAALSAQDSPEAHAQDTLAAGAGINDPAATHALTEMGPGVVHRLNDLGAPFDHNADGSYVLNREAAHGLARVARVGGDLAGKKILEAVVAAAKAAPHIDIWEGAVATGLIKSDVETVIGAVVERGGRTIEVYAPVVVLASGGSGGLYAVTTNPANLRGEGMAMAALAGAEIADPEFVQFHPTAINIGADPAPLATEALRGEGATLITKDGYRFAFDDHGDGELAPRDIVARAVHRANTTLGGAYLDCRTAIGAHFPHEFPTVFASCMAAGIDPRVQPIPVAPAAHYHMGGIRTNIDGHTSLRNLFAVGECASTGVHGANRLASNSLLEAAAFGERVGQKASRAAAREMPRFAPDPATILRPAQPPRLTPEALKRLRDAMQAHAAVIRDEAGLKTLLQTLDALEATFKGALPLVAARLIAQCALQRRESRGSHYRKDHPETATEGQRTFIRLTETGLMQMETQKEVA
ncbi:L-aspartate oxidase [Asticcacaulis sp. AND118]|uniref:L-aspartate oxidase n=1 Tax=Asticcacaulis sp. AND118 TaxID=2840468 RepID=UPI001CFF5B20|nr:L-aspartate oxidase [Asticcacaulis sp. AND118]UDF02746.1 L-aspartate oxidase [Asticcacaulis sp. AND118]